MIIHELLHVLGSPHEHQRPDRDKYIDIKWTNVYKGLAYNFFKFKFENDQTGLELQCPVENPVIGPDGPEGGPVTEPEKYDRCLAPQGFKIRDYDIGYDYASIMHYSTTA